MIEILAVLLAFVLGALTATLTMAWSALQRLTEQANRK